MLGVHKTINLPQSTEYAKEMARWEAFPSKWGGAGRPYQYREFPKRVYKAEQTAEGRVITGETCPDARDLPNFLSRGFHESQQAAIDALAREQTEHGKLAAERNWEIAHGRISEQAAAEVRAAEADHGARHLPAVPETPIRATDKRRRQREAVTA